MKKRILSFLVMFLLVIQLVPGFAAGAVQLTVPSEFSIDGNTSYDLTISEYLRLLDTVHIGIQAELDAMCEEFPHFDSIKPNDGCTVFTVTVNSTALTAEEKGAENRMYEMRDQMAACGTERLRSETVQKARCDSHSTGHCCRVDSRSGGNPGSDAGSYSDSRSHSCPNSSGDADTPSDTYSRTVKS